MIKWVAAVLAALIIVAPNFAKTSEDVRASTAGEAGDPCEVNADCAPGLVCVDGHYASVEGGWIWQPQACAYEQAVAASSIVEDILDLGTVVVTARRIEPPNFRIFYWRPPPQPSFPLPPTFPPSPVPLPEPTPEPESSYHFGKCVRILGGSYLPTEVTDEFILEWAANFIEGHVYPRVQAWINQRFVTHHDVIWGERVDSSASVEFQGAGFHPVSTRDAFRPEVSIEWNGPTEFPPFEVRFEMPGVPGEIRMLRLIPEGCGPYEITDQSYGRINTEIERDTANPPEYRLFGNNCQNWAAKIEAMAVRAGQ